MGLNTRYKTALVTGASSGLGAAFSRMLAREGVSVWGTSRNPETMEACDGVYPVRMELSDPSSIREGWEKAEIASGGIDLLINNAGYGRFGPVRDESDQEWRKQIEILLLAPVMLSRMAHARMESGKRGCIVFVSSMAVEFPIPFMGGYNAGKSGLSSFADSFGLEVAQSGVLIVDFRPGDFKTGFNQAMNVKESTALSDSRTASTWARMEQLMQRAPEPDRAARDLQRALVRGRSGVVRSGSLFQTTVAPILHGLVPNALSRWVRRRYFRSG
jgi:NAD(P)-dependent dehydrogenase (short-subunit alcohol dehydrogenase family)